MGNGCTKKAYSDFTEASKVLDKIKSDTKYSSKEKQEQRVYTCPLCGKCHITSISQRENSIFKEEMKNRREYRVSKAAQYWENKLGIKKP